MKEVKENNPVKNPMLTLNTLSEAAKEYNEDFDNVKEEYKNFKPAPGIVLVRLLMNEEVQTLNTGRMVEGLNTPETMAMCYYSFNPHKNGFGRIIAGNNAGANVMVRYDSFFFQSEIGFIVSGQFEFVTPKHKDKGYFLIPEKFIIGEY